VVVDIVGLVVDGAGLEPGIVEVVLEVEL